MKNEGTIFELRANILLLLTGLFFLKMMGHRFNALCFIELGEYYLSTILTMTTFKFNKTKIDADGHKS
jgi:hypothetical protein